MRNISGMARVMTLAAAICLWPASFPGMGAETELLPKHRFDVWRTEDGLPQSSITAILQSRDGYLWLGTQRGLVRFDGFVFKVFDADNTPQLKSDNINRLFEDEERNLWIGTENGGVTRYREGKFSSFDSADGLADNSVSAIGADSQGNVWVGTASGGLHQFREWEFVSYPVLRGMAGSSENRVFSIAPGGGRKIWLSTPEVLGHFQEGEFVPVLRDSSKTLHMSAARDGGLWVVVDGHLVKFDSQGGTNDFGACLPAGETVRITSVHEDRKGRVWIGTYGEGLIEFEEGKFTRISTADGLLNNLILAVQEDMDGNLWIGTNGGGLYRMKEPLFDIYAHPGGLSANVVLSICESHDGSMWIGTDGGGLSRLREGRFVPVTLQRDARIRSVWAVYEDREGTVWIGTGGKGVYQLKEDNLAPYRKSLGNQKVRAIYQDAKGTMWIGTEDSGVTRIEGEKITRYTQRDGLSSNDVRAFCEDRQGNLWIGTAGGGLNRFAEGRFQVFQTRNGLASDYIRAMYEDRQGALWIGTGGGLSRLKDGRFQSFSMRNNLADNIISQVFEDDRGNLWMGSFRGVFRVTMRDLERVSDGSLRRLTSVVYGKADGLIERECTGGVQPSGWKSRDGRLWFPTINGVAVVDPAAIKMNPRPPPVVIEDFEVDGKSLGSGSTFTIPYGKEKYSIYYTAFNFTSPRRLRFQYKLTGVDPEWVDAGPARKANYGFLPPGTYQFQVIAGNNDGKWNEIGKSIQLTILPPFWRTWWFLSSAGLLVIAAFAGTFRYLSVKKLQRKLELLQQQHALDNERARIAKDMHDDLGARMTQIGLLSELITREAHKEKEAQALAAKLAAKSREVASTLDEIVWAVNPRNDTFDRLLDYLVHYAEEFFEITPVRCRMEVPTDLPDFPLAAETRHSLFLAYKETLNNIIKHAEASEVRIRVSVTDPVVELVIEDNGKGFDPGTVRSTSNGLINLKKRLEDIGGQCELNSEPGRGTRVKLSFRRQG